MAQHFKFKFLSKMNQTIKQIKGRVLVTVDIVATESIKSSVQGNNNDEIRGEYYELLKESINKNGVLTPIIVDVETKQIISGNLRHQIALELNIPEVRVVFEELERANMIMNFYNQQDPQSSECENYINQFTSIMHQIGIETEVKAFELIINELCMCSDDVYYAFRIFFDNIFENPWHDISIQLVLTDCNINEFTSALQWASENNSQEYKQLIEVIAIKLILMCDADADVLFAFDELLNDIYLGRFLV